MTRRSENPKVADAHDASRRDFVKKAAYVAPAVLSMQAFSAVAKAGSSKDEDSGSKPCKPKKSKKKPKGSC